MKAVLRKLVVVAALLLVGCQPPSRAIETAAPTPADTSEVVQRFTDDIWPAINDYNLHPGQGSPGAANPAYPHFWGILDKRLDKEAWGRAGVAARELGGNVDSMNGPAVDGVRDSDLDLAQTQVTSLNPPNATLHVCYTYTAQYGSDADPVLRPAASEAIVQLHKTDTWYLSSITADHVVPNCDKSTT